MDYSEMIRETDEMVRRVMLHSEVCTWILAGAGIVLFTVLGILVWMEHREKMKYMKAMRRRQEEDQREWQDINDVFGTYGPVVTDVTQRDGGRVYRRMGAAGRRS